jgi:hypothetical protein
VAADAGHASPMSRQGHRDSDGDWVAPRSRSVKPVTSGSTGCGGCGHSLSSHAGREACSECSCLWFKGAPVGVPAGKGARRGRRSNVVASSLPVVMGEGRRLQDDLHAGSHTWGGVVTVTHSIDPAQQTGKTCGVCRKSIVRNQVMVPLRGAGHKTVWAHKACHP